MKVTAVPQCYYSTKRDMLNKKTFTPAEAVSFNKDVERLNCLLKLMDLPMSRKSVNYSNLVWLKDNLKKRNEKHPKYLPAISIARRLIRKKHLFLHEQSFFLK